MRRRESFSVSSITLQVFSTICLFPSPRPFARGSGMRAQQHAKQMKGEDKTLVSGESSLDVWGRRGEGHKPLVSRPSRRLSPPSPPRPLRADASLFLLPLPQPRSFPFNFLPILHVPAPPVLFHLSGSSFSQRTIKNNENTFDWLAGWLIDSHVVVVFSFGKTYISTVHLRKHINQCTRQLFEWNQLVYNINNYFTVEIPT